MKLSVRITLLASIVSIFFILLVFTNTQHRIIGESKQHIVKDYEYNLQYLNDSFKLILEKSTDTISLIAMLREDLLKENLYILKNKFEIHLKDISNINGIKLISIEGKELLTVSRNRLYTKNNQDISYKNDDFFINVLQNRKIYYDNIKFNNISNQIELTLSKAVSNPKTQKILAVIKITFSLESLKELITNKLINGNGIALFNLNTNEFIYKSSTIDKIDEKLLLKQSSQDNAHIISQKDEEFLIGRKDFSFDRLKIKLLMANQTKNVYSFITNTFNSNLLILMIFIVLLALIMYFFINYSLNPLKNLIRQIQTLSNKLQTSKTQTKINDSDEIENIKKHFNFFIQLINKDRQKLQEYNETLEDKIDKEVKKNQERERELAQQAKLASMGEMIGNIAHQWRQPLSVISTIASGIKVNKEFGKLDEDKLMDQMDSVVEQTEYLSKTIDDFRSFIKKQGKKSTFSVTSMLDKMLSLVNSSIKNNHIVLETNFKYDVPIHGYENELIQAFINIINNSKDALKANDDDIPKVILIETQKVTNHVEIIIKDNGGGIDNKILSRIFEPYFTTKHQSVGTGIGLSIVDQIIRERNHGTIQASNTEFEYDGKTFTGACFKIMFNCAD